MRAPSTVLLLALVVATGASAAPPPRAKASDFRCLLDGVRPKGRSFFVFHRNRRALARAVAISESGRMPKRGYPTGTILQLFPFEAMVKRPRRFNPEGNGWEFVRLAVTADGRTEVLESGRGEVRNAAGSCQGCHARVAPAHDLVCEFVIGAEGLGLTDDQIRALQAGDPRCR